MTALEVAAKLVAMCKQGQFLQAGDALWADDVVSIEPMTGEMARLQGKAAVRAKGEWWVGAHEVHGVEVQGPYLNGDQFMVRFTMDLTPKESGQRRVLDEFGVYCVEGGKITEERFFVPESYFQSQG